MFSVSLEQIKECSREQLDKKKKWKSMGVDCGNSEINFLREAIRLKHKLKHVPFCLEMKNGHIAL